MKSVGQIVGGVVGGVIGFFAGNPIIGAQIGMTIGGLLDPPKGPTISGPRLSDLSFQTSSYGVPLARVYGTVPIVGNIFWLENNQLKETVKKKKQGGKGGPSTTTKTYSYSATFAVALCDTSKTGPIAGIRRIWIGSTLWYNAGSDDLETIIAGTDNIGGGTLSRPDGIYGGLFDIVVQNGLGGGNARVYIGTADQLPDARMQADIGVDDCPAYRRTAYIVFNDLPLEKWGNSLQAAQVKVEVVTAQAEVAPELLDSVSVDFSASSGNHDGVAHYMTSEKVVFYRPGWGPTFTTPDTLHSAEALIGRTIMRPDASAVGEPYLFSHGWSDSDVFNAPPSPPAYFGDATGRFVYKNGVWYGFIFAGTIYRNAGTVGASWISVGLTNVKAITVDDDGNLYALHNAGLRVYDGTLGQIADYPLTFPEVYQSGQEHLAFDAGTFYAFFLDNLYIIDADFGGHSAAYAMPITSGYQDHFQYTVSGGIAIFAGFDALTSVAIIERIRFAHSAAGLIPLGDIISAEMQLSQLIWAGDIDVSDLADDVRGYRISGGSIRSAIAPLQGAYPFDLIPSGYQIKAVPRGNASVATIDIGELGAISGGGMVDVVLDGPSREMDTQLPRKMVIKHLDPARDYDINEQNSERGATDSVDTETQDLPLVLLPDEAAGMAQALLYLRWLERNDYAFTLPPTYSHLEPADVINVLTDYAAIPLRLTEISYGADGVLQCRAKPNASAIYTPNATGGQGATPDGTIVLAGESDLLLIDIPLLRNVDDEPGFIAVMGSASASWPGGVAFRSDDSGQTYDEVQAFSAPGTYGVARGTLSADEGALVDAASTLTIDWIAGTPESISATQFANGYNYFAYGADQRWEILQARDLDLQSDGSYLVSHFLRGLRGTEWATGLHVAGDYFVLLEDADNAFVGMDISGLAVERNWRGVTVGKSVDDAPDITFAYRGANLKPLAPMNAEGALSGQDFIITWDNRTRLFGSLWQTGVALPLGEASESYVVEILDGSTVVRTLSVTAKTATYTGADQIADFGVPQNSLDVLIYQLSETVGRGHPLAATVIDGAPGTVSLLLHMNGTNGSTTFTDSSVNALTCTAVGSAQISTAQSRFGGASALFNGTNSAVDINASSVLEFGTGDFTVEAWMFPTALTSAANIISRQVDPSGLAIQLRISSGSKLELVLRSPGGGVTTITGTTTITASAQHHAAFARESGTMRLFLDGNLEGSAAFAASLSDAGGTQKLCIGANLTNSAHQNYFTGYVDEVRIVKGGARFTGSFTPPTAEYS